jgi:hypothetical protein
MTAPTALDSLPSTRSDASARQLPATTLTRDLWLGAERVREQGQVYLPRDPGEDDESYRTRLARSVFTNFFRRTIEALVGFIFRKDPVLGTDVPAPMVRHWENIDNAGTHGAVFLRESLQDAMVAGHAAWLIEYPDTQGRVLRKDEERQVQPYWVPLRKEQLLSWRTATEAGRLVLTQLVVEEKAMEPSGLFGEKEVTRYRVFTREGSGQGAVVRFRLLRVTEQKSVVQEAEGAYPTQPEIPVVEVPTSGKRSLFESDPPLLDVGYLNLAHYQVRSDFHTSVHKTCVPIWVETGVDAPTYGADGTPQEVVLGPSHGRSFTNADADARYVAHDGAALASVKQALDDLKDEIGTLGVAMLAPQKRAAETVEAKRMDKAGSDSALSVTARALQDAAERALDIHARYLGLEDGGSITINRDFDAAVMDAAVMAAYAQLGDVLGLPDELIVEALVAGGRLPEGTEVAAVAEVMGAVRSAKADLALMPGARPPLEQAA